MYSETIGIYIPTYNRVELLKNAVSSVLAQTYQNFKLVIVDDGSSDKTFQYLSSLTDKRILYIHHLHSQGACRSRNEAISFLDTELVTGLDDDDEFLPTRLEDLVTHYNDNNAFVCSGYYWNYGVYRKALFNQSREITLSDAFDLNQCSNQILVKKTRILEVGGFDENIPALQDHDLWIRLISKFGNAYRLGKPLYVVNDDQNLERISSVKNKLKAIKIFEQKHKDIMLLRNVENFVFYKKKVNNESFTFTDLLQATQYGLVGLKLRYFFSQYFKRLSQARLNYLRTGRFSQMNRNTRRFLELGIGKLGVILALLIMASYIMLL